MPLLNQQYRHLTLRHEQRLLTNKPSTLAPGCAQFSSYYLPSLNAGKHTTNFSQNVTSTLPDDQNGDPNLIDRDPPKSRQRRTVNLRRQQHLLAPQYSLPEDAVVSVFPTPGHTAQSLTLPHIVLKNPHCPWERDVVDKDAHDADSLNSVPWLALVIFTAEELALDVNERGDYLGIAPTEEPTETLGFTLNVKDATAEGKVPRPSGRGVFISKPDGEQIASRSSNTMDLITFPAALFHKLFVRTSEDQNGNQVSKGDIKVFRFLSHVRTVATDGMLSTAETDGEPGTFALSISPRIAPQTITTPTTLYAHLISLQGVHGCAPPDLSTGSKARVVMTSLYSWSYTSLPPDTSSTVHTFENLDKGLPVLHTDRKGSIVTDKTEMEKLVAKRLEEGFTLTRYRTVTGEVTSGLLRGPLVPVKVRHPRQSGMIFQTNVGADLNILDPDLGLMDLSYSTAWQVGRTLAQGDSTFATALGRLRGVLSKEALSKSKPGVHMTLGASRDTVLSEAAKVVSRLQGMNEQFASPLFITSLNKPLAQGGPSDTPVSYQSIPTNRDYVTVQSWILDKLHLADVPAHYLIADPSHVSPETLRFFHVDENWTEALIDGALSLANQSTSEDYVRLAIKKQLQGFINTPLEGLGYCQQMPKYGFIMRSEILVQFPDLVVSPEFAKVASPNDEEDKIKPQAPILIQRRLSSDMMLVLFDRTPPDLTALEFTLPSHQQPFVIGSGLDRDNLKITHLKIYTTEPENSPQLEPPSTVKERHMPLDPAPRPWKASEFVDIDSGVMNVEHYATVIHSVLKDEMEESMYTAQGPTSAVFGIQLNEPIDTLRIAIPSNLQPTRVEDCHNPAAGAFTFHVPEFPAGDSVPKA